MCLHHVHHIPYRSHSSLALRPKHIFFGTILGVRPLKLEMEWLHVVTPCTHAPQEPMGMKEACHGLSKKLWGSSGCSALLWCITKWVGYVGSMLVALLMWLALGHGLTGCKLCVRYGQHVQWWAMVALSGLGHGQDDEQWVGCLCAR